MYKLSPTGMKWLKGLHLFTVCCWVGGAVSLSVLYFLKRGVDSGGVLYGINRSINFIDMNVVVLPGALGCLATGLAYGLFSKWGFFRHGWMVWKWAVTLAAIGFGTFYLGPWEVRMMDISGELGLGALGDPDYLRHEFLHDVCGTAQLALLAATVFVSVFKPWKNLGIRNSIK